MKENYFLINGIMYIVRYVDFKIDVYKLINRERVELTEEEKETIQKIIKRNSSYIYNSIRLGQVLESNTGINSNEIASTLLEWLESVIPLGERENFYRNIGTLVIEEVEEIEKENVAGQYDAKENKIRMLHPSKYETEYDYAETLLHELTHMASSKYDFDTRKTISGLDETVMDFRKRNRGLTEGITEVIAYNGVRNANEVRSGSCIEALIAHQLSNIIDPSIIINSYFTNRGTEDMQEELMKIGYDDEKAFELFRSIEANYHFARESEKENALGNIQSSLLDYFETRLKTGIENDTISPEQIPRLFTTYERSIITPSKMEKMGYNPEIFDGLQESVNKYLDIKARYGKYVSMATDNEKEISNAIPLGKAGYSSVIILSIVTAIIALGIIVLGVYLGM